MKGYFEGWRRYLREDNGTQKIDIDMLAAKASEKNVISGKEAAQQGINIIDFDPDAARRIAQELADKAAAQLGKEIGRGAMGIVYEIRGEEGEGADMMLKVTQFPHEKKGYTLARWKKRQLKRSPELASVLPEVGNVVDIIYDFKEGWLNSCVARNI